MAKNDDKENKREVALATLVDKTTLGLAVPFFVEYQYEGEGENTKDAIHNYLYAPTVASEEGQARILKDFRESRQEGRRYTGTSSEHTLIKRAADAYDAAIMDVTFDDLLELTESEVKASGKYKGVFVRDLVKKKDKKAIQMVEAYKAYVIEKHVSAVRAGRCGGFRKSLEKLASGQEE